MKLRGLIMAALVAIAGLVAGADTLRSVIINGEPMVSLREFGETYDAVIDYNGVRDGIVITLDYRTLDFVPYSRIAWVNGRQVIMPVSAVVIDDEMYISIRFVSDVFDLDCQFDADYAHMSVFNPWTRVRLVLVFDLEWGSREHRWRRDVDCREFRGYRVITTRRSQPERDRVDVLPPFRDEGRYDDRQNDRPQPWRDRWERPQPWRDRGNDRENDKPTGRPGADRPGQWNLPPRDTRPDRWDRAPIGRPSPGRDQRMEDGRQGRRDQDGRQTRPAGEDRDRQEGRQSAPRAGDARQDRQQEARRDEKGRDQGRDQGRDRKEK